MVTDADVERDGSLHRFDDVSEGHLAGGSAEHIAPSGAPSRSHQTLVDQLLDDLLEELPRDAFTCGDLRQRADPLAGVLVCEVDDGPKCVVDLSAHLQKRHEFTSLLPGLDPCHLDAFEL